MKKSDLILKLEHLQTQLMTEHKQPIRDFGEKLIFYNKICERYNFVINDLSSNYPELFGDLVSQKYESVSLLVNPGNLNLFEKEVNHCLDFLRSMPPDNAPFTLQKEGIFFAGQQFDAICFAKEIFSQATQSIVVIDGYVNDKVFELLAYYKAPAVVVSILTYPTQKNQHLKKVLPLVSDFNNQYKHLTIRTSEAFHDRFIIVDNQDFYHIGASIKDAGNRVFMFSRIEEPTIVNDLKTFWENEWSNATPT